MPSTASQSCDVSDTDATFKSSTVGRYPQPHGDAYIGMVSSISPNISWDLMKWTNALKQLPMWHDTPKDLLNYTILQSVLQKPSQFSSKLESGNNYKYPFRIQPLWIVYIWQSVSCIHSKNMNWQEASQVAWKLKSNNIYGHSDRSKDYCSSPSKMETR